MIRRFFRNLGPGTLVAAAFIGPGTVTLCTLAGVSFGMVLLWAMCLSVLATIVLQEMAARLGVVSQKSLAEVVRHELRPRWLRLSVVLLILAAIVLGNAAYQAGNISGGILGLSLLTGEMTYAFAGISFNPLSLSLGLLAFVLLYFGNYKMLEKILVALVLLMSFSFIFTAVITRPDLGQLLRGIFWPAFPEGSLLTVLGLVGTTVVPYNLFLHASLVKEKWKSATDLPRARTDTRFSILLGGAVSMAVIVSAAALQGEQISGLEGLAKSLAPLYGRFSAYFLAVGLFAAGLTSAITAPLAAAYVAQGCLGWEKTLHSAKFRTVWMGVLLLGVIFSSLQINPIQIIKFAQITNGILLPVIAGILLWIMNRKSVLGKYTNTKTENLIGFSILAFSLFLGLKALLLQFF